jgi:tetratricopeptide (TPR) repeat protein
MPLLTLAVNWPILIRGIMIWPCLVFSHALKLDSSGKHAQAANYYLVRIRFSQSMLEEPVKYLDTLLILASADAEVYFIRGAAKSNMMDSKGAIADFDLAIKNNLEYMEAYVKRGVQKINALPLDEKSGFKVKCLEEVCKDLKKVKILGGTSVDDMLFLYCRDCK